MKKIIFQNHHPVMGIDPGQEKTAYVFIRNGEINSNKILPNESLRNKLKGLSFWMMKENVDIDFAIESLQSYGTPFGKHLRDTCIQIGRMIEIVGDEFVFLYPRPTIKAHIADGVRRPKDTDVRRALIARFGGTKKGEPLHGIVKDMWAALAVAVYHIDTNKKNQIDKEVEK